MPTYVYECEKCNLHIEENRKVDQRDNLFDIILTHCPNMISTKEKMLVISRGTGKTNLSKCITKGLIDELKEDEKTCQLRRVPTCGSFKI